MSHDHANSNWSIPQNSDGTFPSSHVHTALLMDIRSELQKLNTLLHCPNFTQMPHDISQTCRNTDTLCRQNANRRKRRKS